MYRGGKVLVMKVQKKPANKNLHFSKLGSYIMVINNNLGFLVSQKRILFSGVKKGTL